MFKQSYKLFNEVKLFYTKAKANIRLSTKDNRIKHAIKLMKSDKLVEMKQYLLTNKIDVNSHEEYESTLLTQAAEDGNAKATEFLLSDKQLKTGIHVSCDCPDHKTALVYAVQGLYIKVIEILLRYGADPLMPTKSGKTAIDLCPKDRKDILDMLKTKIKLGKNYDIKSLPGKN